MPDSADLASTSQPPVVPLPSVHRATDRIGRKRLLLLARCLLVLALCFIEPLWEWIGFAIHSDFYSYMPLMPLITGYLIWIKRDQLGQAGRPGWGAAALAAVAGIAMLGGYFYFAQRGWALEDADYLCAMMLSFLLLGLAAAFIFLGTVTITAISFPLAMLLFMVPYPEAVNDGLENFFQHTSARTAHAFISAVGTPCVQNNLVIVLRGPTEFSAREITNSAGFIEKLRNQSDPVSALLWSGISAPDQKILSNFPAAAASPEAVQNILLQTLNRAVVGPSLYTPARFQRVDLRDETTQLARENPGADKRAVSNRLLLEDAYPHELSSLDFGLKVAPECSGIHSTQVLFITSLLAGYLFLTSPWRRTFFALFIIPLAIVRNGFRIFTIGELCIHVNHNMIDSWIHHKGGPFFFALSLIPFFLVLVWLRKSESKKQNVVQK